MGRDLHDEVTRLRRRLRDIERLAHVGSWQWDVLQDTVVWSEELRRIFGVDLETFDATYAGYVGLVHPDDREMVLGVINTAMERAEGYTFEHRLVRPSGEVRWLHARGDVRTDETGAVVLIQGISVDITERRALDLELRRFVSDAAHELRTPVSTVTYAIGMLAADELPEDQRKLVIDALARNGDRLGRLTESLLDLSTLETAETNAMMQPVDLAHVVDRAIEVVHPDEDERPTIAVEIPDGVAVRAAPDELERVFVNLLTNAAQHGGSNVVVTATPAAEEVVVEIRDDGPGLDPEVAAKLFVPFARGRRAAAGGSGLGLSITRRLVERFGGVIEHRAAERGAVFVIHLETAS